MNRTKEAGRARLFVLVSFVLFVLAAVSTMLPHYRLYLSLALVVLGGFFMLIGAIIRDKAKVEQKTSANEFEDEDEQETLQA